MFRSLLLLLAFFLAEGEDVAPTAVVPQQNQLRGTAFFQEDEEDVEDAEDEDVEQEEATPVKKTRRSRSKKVKAFSDPGFCCHDGGSTDVCNTCYEHSMVASGDFCATESKCGVSPCGGIWCKATCVLAGAHDDDWCSSAYDVSVANSSSYCAQDAASCAECRGQWCAKVKTVPSEPSQTQDDDEEAEETAKKGSAPFCCFSSSVASNACGTCYPEAIAQDHSCTYSAEACAACSGVWCQDETTEATLPEPVKEPKEDADQEDSQEAEETQEDKKAAQKADETEDQEEEEAEEDQPAPTAEEAKETKSADDEAVLLP